MDLQGNVHKVGVNKCVVELWWSISADTEDKWGG